MAVSNFESGAFRMPDVRTLSIERARVLIMAAKDLGVRAVQLDTGKPFQVGPLVEHVKPGEIGVKLFGSEEAVQGLERYVEEQLGPEELPPIEV